MSVLSAVSRAVNVLTTIANNLGALCIVVIMVAVGVDIVGRAFFNRPLQGTAELSAALMVIVVMFTMAQGEARGSHIRVDLLSQRLPPRGRVAIDLLAYVVGIVLFSLILNASWDQFLTSWAIKEYSPGVVSVPIYPSKLAVVLGSALLIVQFFLRLVRAALGLPDTATEPEV